MLKLHLHPLGGRLIFWNFILLILVKVIIPHTALQSASLLGLTPPFDSREVIKITNEVRIANNLTALNPNFKLDAAALDKLNDMATKEYFAHVSPDGTTPWYWMKNVQYNYSVAGENLAIGFVTANDTVQGWLNSPSHRANLLNNKYVDIGVAVKSVEISNREGILVVQMFGVPSSIVANPKTQVVAMVKTPAPTILISPSISPQFADNSAQTKGETITVAQEVSTDNSIKPVEIPVTVQSDKIENASKVSGVLNGIYSIYAMIISTATIVAFFFHQRNKSMAFKAALNFAVFLLAILVPMAGISFQGLIF